MSNNYSLKCFECTECGKETFHRQIKRKINRTFNIYYGMKARCLNKKVSSYKNYGGRGIKICSRWLESFDNFYEDMGEPPSLEYSIDRIDNNCDYSPENCRWVSREEQNNNTRQVRYFKYQGERLTTRQWAKKTGIHKSAIDERIKQRWTIEKALTTPSVKGRNQFGTDGIPITFNQKTMSLKKWSIEIEIDYSTLHKRVHKYSWSIERALTTKSLIKRK